MAGRWHSWRAASPLWSVGLLMIVGGVALLMYARRQVRGD